MASGIAWRDAFVERLKATGNVTLAATGAGVSRQQAYRTRNRNKAFRRQWDEAMEQAMDLLEGEARRRATGMNRDFWYAGKVVGSEREYSDALLMFLMRAHRPHLYRENMKVEHSGGMEVTGDRKVTFEFVRPADQHARTLAELAAKEAEEAKGAALNLRAHSESEVGAPVVTGGPHAAAISESSERQRAAKSRRCSARGIESASPAAPAEVLPQLVERRAEARRRREAPEAAHRVVPLLHRAMVLLHEVV